MYFSIVSQAWFSGAQSCVTWPYSASSQIQYEYASEVVSWP